MSVSIPTTGMYEEAEGYNTSVKMVKSMTQCQYNVSGWVTMATL